MQTNRWSRAAILMGVILTAGSAHAEESEESSLEQERSGSPPASLDVEFHHCSEYAGFVQVPLANVAALVPAVYQIASPAPDVANAILRVAHCRSVRVAGHETGEGTVAQIGVNIVAPDGTGDINNYTLSYDTTGKELAKALRRAGIRAEHDDALTYQRDDHSDHTSARLVMTNGRNPGPPFTFTNEVLIPTSATPAFVFTANWWQTNGKTTTEMASIFPAILFGPNSPNVTVHVPAGSALARILNGTSATFAGLSVANDFEDGHMHVGPATP